MISDLFPFVCCILGKLGIFLFLCC